MKIKQGDTVQVLTGKDKGKTGTVVKRLLDKNQVIVEGVAVVTRHQRSRTTKGQGQIVEKSMPISASNVALIEDGKPVRVGYIFEGEGDKKKKVRVSRASGKKI